MHFICFAEIVSNLPANSSAEKLAPKLVLDSCTIEIRIHTLLFTLAILLGKAKEYQGRLRKVEEG